MKFNYFKFPLPERSKLFGWSILKPIIPIEISHGEKKLRYNALIDSGADLSIIDGAIGDFLGLDMRSGDREIFGLLGQKGFFDLFIVKFDLIKEEIEVRSRE
ncbi:MAG: hypothetical protein AAB589_02065 [Patescibacteria group bacterium]